MSGTGTQTLDVISKAGHFNKWMYQVIEPFLKGEVLEIGSGIGNISAFAVQGGTSITLSDLEGQYRQYLQEKFSGFANVKGIISLDLQHPDFKTAYVSLKGKFQTVFLLNVIEHLQDDRAAVSNCRYLLKYGGCLVILAPAYQGLFCRFDKELGHYRRYTVHQLQRLISRENFETVHKQYFNLLGIAGWFVFGKLLKKKMIGSSEMQLYNHLVPVLKFADKLVLSQAGLSAILVGKNSDK
jgi:2-polyprenyl-3-methyl-5-hydroxy-6-metoxy-1,4-benzoquinol methylase